MGGGEYRKKSEKKHIPERLSDNILDVMIRPKGVNIFSSSCCVMLRGMPLTYRFAPLIDSLLGRANETCREKNRKIETETKRKSKEREREKEKKKISEY